MPDFAIPPTQRQENSFIFMTLGLRIQVGGTAMALQARWHLPCSSASPVMGPDRFTVRFWGVRGSVATAGPEFASVGGNTSCVEIRAGEEIVILDAGTGLFPLGQTLVTPTRATFLFSHVHWDHIQGFPLFRPAYQSGNRFTLYGPGDGELGVEAALHRQMQPPHFPVSLAAMQAELDFRSIRPGDEIQIGRVSVRTVALHHPQGCMGYRIGLGRHGIVYATDTEQLEGGLDPAIVSSGRRRRPAHLRLAVYRGRVSWPRRARAKDLGALDHRRSVSRRPHRRRGAARAVPS